GIFNAGNMTVSGTTVYFNVAYADGGGIYNAGNMSVTNSTVYQNATYTYGGGIYNAGSLTLTDDTVAGNFGWNLLATHPYFGGGIFTTGTVQMDNTIVANNTATTNGPDVYGTIAVANYDLIGNPSGATYSGTGNLTGSAGLAGSLTYNNGAPT